VGSVFVCGGGSRAPGLLDVLGDRLRLSVQSANPLANLVVRDGAFGSLVTDEVAPLLMLPLGLALRKPA
jgi:type IV pilus assembly protein PilM